MEVNVIQNNGIIAKSLDNSNCVNVKFKKLSKDAVIPTYAHPSDAGADLTATRVETDKDNHCIVYHTDIAVEIPEGYVGLVFPRSSIFKKSIRLTNSVGIIDSHYRNEIMAKFDYGNMTKPDDMYFPHERIAQLIIIPYPKVNYIEAEELSDTDRGTGGYGSTGK